MQLPQYMRQHFPGLQLNPALFYSWTVGMRFELNAARQSNAQWETILERATKLYESVFESSDVGLIVSGHEIEIESKARRRGKLPEFRNSVFSLSRRESLGLHGIAGRQRLTSYQDRESRITSVLRWTEIEPRRINYKRILRAIMHRDFWNRRPRIDDYVYFVNTSRNMILHMYDDRGLDIIAPQVDDLRPIYQTHKNWILGFDSAAIAQMFESNTPIPDFDYRRSPPPSVS
jgi:hypothetical protein